MNTIRQIPLMFLLGGMLLIPQGWADEPGDDEQVPTRIFPTACLDWQEKVEQLESSSDELERELGQLYAEPDLQFCQTRTIRVSESSDRDWNFDLPEWLLLAELGRWLSIFVLLGLVVWLAWRWRHQVLELFTPSPARRDRPDEISRSPVERNKPLPSDIPARALEAWQNGQTRAAMSLLYRGAVARLLPDLRDREARTEREVLLALSQQLFSATTRSYMDQLVQSWLRTAWANTPPDQATFDQLCQQWPGHCQPAARTGS